MDLGRGSCHHAGDVWSRVLLVLAFVCLATRLAQAQAPPPSFFDGRSNAELHALASNLDNDILLRRSAATRLVFALADAGELDAADAAAREFAKNIDPRAGKHAEAVRRRGEVHRVALLALGAVLGVAAVSLAVGGRFLRGAVAPLRRIAPIFVFFVLYSGLVGGYLASSYDNGSPVPFLVFATSMLPLVVLFRTWSAVGSPRVAARAFRGVAAAAATVALGFLVVEQINSGYLEGFGL
jgi:hypothetical protein